MESVPGSPTSVAPDPETDAAMEVDVVDAATVVVDEVDAGRVVDVDDDELEDEDEDDELEDEEFTVQTGWRVVSATRLYEPDSATVCPAEVAHPAKVLPIFDNDPELPSRLISPLPVFGLGTEPESDPVAAYVKVKVVELLTTSEFVRAPV